MEDFSEFEKRLSALDEDVRTVALKHAAQYFAENKCSREEALEKGISKAEMEKRNI